MLGLEILYNSEDDFKLAAIDYAAEFTGSDSMAFAEEWLLHDHRDSRTESAESVPQDSLSDTREKILVEAAEAKQDVERWREGYGRILDEIHAIEGIISGLGER